MDFDPQLIDYATLLEMVWDSHDPTRPQRRSQYMAAIWCEGERQLELARASGERAAHQHGGALSTRIEPLERFHRAEDYHQKYRLRRDPELLGELVERYGTDRAMVDSTAAARINGLLRGYGDRELVERWLPMLGLTTSAERTLRQRVPG